MNTTDLRVLRTRKRLQNALLKLLEENNLQDISIKDLCNTAQISRNAFYQNFGYKENLFNYIAAKITEEIRESLTPVIFCDSSDTEEMVVSCAKDIISGISGIRKHIYVMLKNDNGSFLKKLTELFFEKNMKNTFPLSDEEDLAEMRLSYEFQSAGMAAFIVRWLLHENISEERAGELLAQILLQFQIRKPAAD